VTTVTITSGGDNNVVDIVEGQTQTFTCTTDSSRPAAWIQRYIGGQSVTNQATPLPPQEDGDKFISSHCIQAAGLLESAAHATVHISHSTIYTILLSPAGMIVTVVTGIKI
jgi:hypothetical protein